MTDRDEKLLRLALLTIAVERMISVQFWQAFDNDTKRVLTVHRHIQDELAALTRELWPEHD